MGVEYLNSFLVAGVAVVELEDVSLGDYAVVVAEDKQH